MNRFSRGFQLLQKARRDNANNVAMNKADGLPALFQPLATSTPASTGKKRYCRRRLFDDINQLCIMDHQRHQSESIIDDCQQPESGMGRHQSVSNVHVMHSELDHSSALLRKCSGSSNGEPVLPENSYVLDAVQEMPAATEQDHQLQSQLDRGDHHLKMGQFLPESGIRRALSVIDVNVIHSVPDSVSALMRQSYNILYDESVFPEYSYVLDTVQEMPAAMEQDHQLQSEWGKENHQFQPESNVGGVLSEIDVNVIHSEPHSLCDLLHQYSGTNTLVGESLFPENSYRYVLDTVQEMPAATEQDHQLQSELGKENHQFQPELNVGGVLSEIDVNVIHSEPHSLSDLLRQNAATSTLVGEPMLPENSCAVDMVQEMPAVVEQDASMPYVTTEQNNCSPLKQSAKPRKRQRNMESWKRNQRKHARQHGFAYTSSAGKHVEAKHICLSGDLCHCRLECSDRIPAADRQKLFESFYMLDEDAKNAYICANMKPLAPTVRLCQAKRHRAISFVYYVTVGCNSLRVCKNAFMKLHAISGGKVRFIGEQLSSGRTAPRPSARGKHNNRFNRCPEDMVSNVKEHIRMFPAEESHYSRTCNPNRKYLSPELTVSKMYMLYKSWCQDNNTRAVSERTYRDVFNSNFNLGFGSPKSDTCGVCDAAEGSVSEHKLRAECGFRSMKKDRQMAAEDGGVAYITFDMQKTLPLPKLSTSIAFYLRQVWLYDVGIHLVRKSESRPFFNIWSEDQAGRGCEEVGSALLTFFNTADIKEEVLLAWSDSCAGQNKNFYILCLWQYLVAKKRFQVIHHKFPEPGHSYLDSDRDFAHVEKAVKQRQNIYCVDDYHSIMAQSQLKHRPTVTRIGNGMYAIKKLPSQLGLCSRNVNTEGQKALLKDMRWIRIRVFGYYDYKTSHEESEDWKTVKILKNNVDVQEAAEVTLELRRLKPAIKKAKIEDMKKQIRYIPEMYRPFYHNIVSMDPSQNDAEESDCCEADECPSQPSTSASSDIPHETSRVARQEQLPLETPASIRRTRSTKSAQCRGRSLHPRVESSVKRRQPFQELNNLEEVHSLRATSSSRSGKTRRLQWEN